MHLRTRLRAPALDVPNSCVTRGYRSDTLKIFFLVRSLHCGGQQRQLVLLSQRLCERGHDVVVAVFYSGGPLEKELKNSKVRVRALTKRGRWDVVGFLIRIVKVLREERPDVLHGYLFEPNLIGTILRPLFPTM